MTTRVLYYALGGGLGHLVRAGRFLRQHGLADDALILSASPHADDPRHRSGIAVRRVPSALHNDIPALRDWLSRCISEFAPQRLCVDCFPAGLLGELGDLPAHRDIELWLIARLLNWTTYAPLLAGAPRYALAWRMEPLHPAHEAWLRAHADVVRDCQLQPPSAPSLPAAATSPFWLVSHSGPADEVQELIDYARELHRSEGSTAAIAVASLDLPPALAEDCYAIDPTAILAHFAAAERIVCAAGFNTIAETEPWRDKRHVLPFPRRYDDQFARAVRVAQVGRSMASPPVAPSVPGCIPLVER